MNLGIVGITYNDYGHFIPGWLKSIQGQGVKEVVLVLGKDHGYTGSLPEWVRVIESPIDRIGLLKNIGLKELSTEWAMVLSIDDTLLPGAVEEFSKYPDADVIIPAYTYNGSNITPDLTVQDILSPDFCCTGGRRTFFHGSSPFKRKLWKANRFKDSDCSNALFWIDIALTNPAIQHTPVVCLTYRKWLGSHSDVTLGERTKRAVEIREYRHDER